MLGVAAALCWRCTNRQVWEGEGFTHFIKAAISPSVSQEMFIFFVSLGRYVHTFYCSLVNPSLLGFVVVVIQRQTVTINYNNL
ncbi:hypothetical protein FKM82_014426 [Ascaphus truei]